MLIKGLRRVIELVKQYPIKDIDSNGNNFEVTLSDGGYIYAEYNKGTDSFICDFAFEKGGPYVRLKESEVNDFLESFYPTEANGAVLKLDDLLDCFCDENDCYSLRMKRTYLKGYLRAGTAYNAVFTVSAGGATVSFRTNKEETFGSSDMEDIKRYCEVVSSF